MFTRHVDQSLTRYYDGELQGAERARVEVHLASCERCRAALDEIQFSATLVRQLTAVSAPPSVWHGIDAALAAPHRTFAARLPLQWAAACAILLVVAGGAYWWTRDSLAGPWEVAHTKDGVSRRMASGEWVETEDGSEARITVGTLGTVNVAPGTRVRLGEVSESEYRLALARGTISAEIVAPPRLFIVDTPASTVVDLGCAYTVTVGEDGAGLRSMRFSSRRRWFVS
jgi:anti-sigma factor RsiW